MSKTGKLVHNANTETHDESFIGPMVDNMIDRFIDEFKKRNFKEKIMRTMINPILSDIEDRYYPYFMSLVILLVIIIILLALLLVVGYRYKTSG